MGLREEAGAETEMGCVPVWRVWWNEVLRRLVALVIGASMRVDGGDDY